MGVYEIKIKATFEKGGECIFLPGIWYSFNNLKSPSKEQIVSMYKEVMSLPFETLPLALGNVNLTAEVLIQKRLEGFPFPPSDKLEITIG